MLLVYSIRHALTPALRPYADLPDMNPSIVVVAPVIVLFFLAQRYFVQGIVLTGMKG